MKITSQAFQNGDAIPSRFTCEGEDINPPLEISDVPEGTKSLVLIVDDPDAPAGTWVHWLVWDIQPSTLIIPKGARGIGIEGTHDGRAVGYGGPCPPRGPSHTYRFKVYAMDRMLELRAGADKKMLAKEMEGHIIDMAEIDGEFQR